MALKSSGLAPGKPPIGAVLPNRPATPAAGPKSPAANRSSGAIESAARRSRLWGSRPVGEPAAIEPGQRLLILRFRAERGGLLSESLALSRETHAFRGTDGIEEAPVSLRFIAPVETSLLAAAYPNPFRDRAYLRIDVPETGSIRFSAWDARGVLVYQTEWYLEAGRHEMAIDAAKLGESGAYLFRLESQCGAASGRLVLMPGR